MVATETGGRLNREATELIEQAAVAKARSSPVPLQNSTARAWQQRWTTMLAVAAQDALAATLVDEGRDHLDSKDGLEPLATDVWLDE